MKTLFLESATGRAGVRESPDIELTEGWARVAVAATTLHLCRRTESPITAPGGEVAGRIVEVHGRSPRHSVGDAVVTVVRRAAASDSLPIPLSTLEPIPEDLPAVSAVLAAGCGMRASLALAAINEVGARTVLVFSPTRPAAYLLAGMARRDGLTLVAGVDPLDPADQLLAAGFSAVSVLDDQPGLLELLDSLPGPVVTIDFGRPPRSVPPGLSPVASFSMAPAAHPQAAHHDGRSPPHRVIDPLAIARTDFPALRRHFASVVSAITSGVTGTPITTLTLEAALEVFPSILEPHRAGAIVLTPTQPVAAPLAS